MPESTVRRGLADLLADYRGGTALNYALKRQLEDLLPEDAHLTAKSHGLTIGYFEVLPRPGRRLVSTWDSKADLIETISASCNWPFFYSRWPLVWCRGGLAVDGFFALPRTQLGCPQIADETLRVISLPKVEVEGGGAARAVRLTPLIWHAICLC